MSPDCQKKHDARMAIFKAAGCSPEHGKPHFGEDWTAAFNAYQETVMEPLRQALREAIADHLRGVCCPIPEGIVPLSEALDGALEEIEEAYVNNPENKEANA